MNRNKLMLLVAVVAAVVIVAGGFFLGVQPQLAKADEDHASQATVESANQTTQIQIAQLKAQATKLPEITATLESLQRSVPSAPSASAFISELNDNAGSSGATVSSITVGDAQAYSPPVVAPSTSTASSSSATASSAATGTPSPSPSASPTTPAAPKTTTNAAITATDFSYVPVSVEISGTFSQALSFVHGAQNGDRLFLINSVTAEAGSSDSGSGATITATTTKWTFAGFIYVLNTDAAATAATTTTNG